jgi:amidase
MHFDDYQRYDALGLADLVRRGEVHPSELLDTALARADATRSLNAIVMRLDESARQRAQAPFDTSAPFAGVPFLVKDLFQDLKGLPLLRRQPRTESRARPGRRRRGAPLA